MLVKLQNKSKGQSAFTFYMPPFLLSVILVIYSTIYTPASLLSADKLAHYSLVNEEDNSNPTLLSVDLE